MVRHLQAENQYSHVLIFKQFAFFPLKKVGCSYVYPKLFQKYILYFII